MYAFVKFGQLRRGAAAPLVYAGGPGDVVSGALAYWGLRAYTIASIGTNAIRLRRSSDNSESDFATIAGGGLNLSSIASFKGAANLFVVTLYDQTGSGFHLTQASSGSQQPFTLNGLGSLPIMGGLSSGNFGQISRATGPVDTSPYSCSTVAKSSTVAVVNAVSFMDGPQVGFDVGDVANIAYLSDGGIVTGAASDAAWHALQVISNGGTSDVVVNGTSNSGAVGTNNMNGGIIGMFEGGNGGNLSSPFITECGWWPGALSGAQITNLNSNQHTYWGF
jgi:hypothetical protein